MLGCHGMNGARRVISCCLACVEQVLLLVAIELSARIFFLLSMHDASFLVDVNGVHGVDFGCMLTKVVCLEV